MKLNHVIPMRNHKVFIPSLLHGLLFIITKMTIRLIIPVT